MSAATRSKDCLEEVCVPQAYLGRNERVPAGSGLKPITDQHVAVG